MEKYQVKLILNYFFSFCDWAIKSDCLRRYGDTCLLRYSTLAVANKFCEVSQCCQVRDKVAHWSAFW